MQALIVVFCCVVACPLVMFGFMWWLDRNPEEAEMKREERRLLRAKFGARGGGTNRSRQAD